MSLKSRKIKSPITKVIVRVVNRFFTETYKKSDTTNKNDLQNIRQSLKEKTEKRKKSNDIIFSRTEIDGIPVEITTPKNKISQNIIFYIHGGAFMIGLVSYNQRYAEMLAIE